MIVGTNISVRCGIRRTLDQVNVSVVPGKVTAVVGPNGAGKSTLLNALTGRVSLETGGISLDGQVLETLPRAKIARRVSVLQQHFQSAFAFRAFEIVAMGRAAHEGQESRTTAAIFVQQAMAEAGVLDLADRPINQLSGGERQRVFLARALAQILPLQSDSSRYLLLDEPTSSLDLRHQRTTLGFARKTAASGVGVLCVLHDLNLTARFACHAIILQDGCVAASGPPATIFTEQMISSVYGPGLSIFPDPETGAPVILPQATEDPMASTLYAGQSLRELAAEAAQNGEGL
jgi:iron complex transport system ATP-binding protein